jgi:hypothetical protein
MRIRWLALIIDADARRSLAARSRQTAALSRFERMDWAWWRATGDALSSLELKFTDTAPWV